MFCFSPSLPNHCFMTPKDNFRSCCVSNQGERRTGEVGSQGRDFLPWFHTRAQVECSVTDRVASFEPGLDWRPSCGTTDLSAGLVWNGRGLLAGCLRGSVVFLSLGLLSIKGRKRAKAFDGTGMGFHFPIEPSCLLTRVLDFRGRCTFLHAPFRDPFWAACFSLPPSQYL